MNNTEKCHGTVVGNISGGEEKEHDFFKLDGQVKAFSAVKKCVSHNFRLIRNQKGFTQQMFASHIGINRATYAAYEEQRADPPLNIVIIVSNLTGIDINTLLTTELKEEEVING